MANTLILWSGVILTFAVWSFIWKINPVYRLAEHIFIGFGAAHFAIVVYHGTLKPQLIDSLKSGKLLTIVPGILGLLYLARLLPEYGWVSRYPMALTIGIASGLSVRGSLQGTLFPQMLSVIKPLDSINGIIIALGVITTIFYFFFGFEAKGATKTVKDFGRLTMMLYFGSLFGNTVMSRMSYLLGRLQFLFGDVLHWIPGT